MPCKITIIQHKKPDGTCLLAKIYLCTYYTLLKHVQNSLKRLLIVLPHQTVAGSRLKFLIEGALQINRIAKLELSQLCQILIVLAWSLPIPNFIDFSWFVFCIYKSMIEFGEVRCFLSRKSATVIWRQRVIRILKELL